MVKTMKLSWPIKGIGVKQGIWISQYFGEHAPSAPPYGGNGLHNGLDIACPVNTPIYASHDGQAKFITEAGGFGIHVKIYGTELMTVYAHLNSHEGKDRYVKEGDLIGLSGNTGYSTGAHCHFGKRLNNANQNDGFFGYSDPLPLMKIRARYLKDKEEIILAIPLDTMDRWTQLKRDFRTLDDYEIEEHFHTFKKPWP